VHHDNFSFSLHQISKIEGHASLDVDISDGQLNSCRFYISDFKRFYTKAVEKKPALAAPLLLSRICGTCSNAHIMAALKAVESALGITVPQATDTRRELVNAGMYIRDHALHLIIFVLPDVYQVDSVLDFDETDPVQRAMLENLFLLKKAGNNLAIFAGGRAVHAPDMMVGGFSKPVDTTAIPELINNLTSIRPIAIELVKLFSSLNFKLERNNRFLALRGEADHFDYLKSHQLKTHDGNILKDTEYREHLEHVAIPYSQASGYQFDGADFMVGSLARVNLNLDQLHPKTKKSLANELKLFPSTNIYFNNLAQAIEIVDSIDRALELLTTGDLSHESAVKATVSTGDGIGIIEAPRGTLYHKAHVVDNIINQYEVIVPTGQNQINIENDLKLLLSQLIGTDMDQHQIEHECEKLIRAYDPCMSCAAHFLKVKWIKK
jgi:coenzyme F420-reducing hydrogenase alpha subunit